MVGSLLESSSARVRFLEVRVLILFEERFHSMETWGARENILFLTEWP